MFEQKKYARKHCSCGAPLPQKYNDNGSVRLLCDPCIDMKNKLNELDNRGFFGSQRCPVSGIEKEIAVCMETKANAILRHRQGKGYEMAHCRLCGSSEARMPVKEFDAPDVVAITEKVVCSDCKRKFTPRNTNSTRCYSCQEAVAVDHGRKRSSRPRLARQR